MCILCFSICRFNSAKKDNDFIYHETVPSLETLASVKGNTDVDALDNPCMQKVDLHKL